MKRILYLLFLIIVSTVDLCSQENNATLCSDGIDNDGDGLIDCEDVECFNLNNNGCATCTEGLSFADVLIEYQPGCPLADPEPSGAIGVSDWTGGTVDEPEFVFLGQGGFLKLGFTNNLLVNSGDNQEDFWVFEIGPAVEASSIALRPANAYTETQLQLFVTDNNADGYYEIGDISGATASLDIDAIIPGYPSGDLQFDAIEIQDIVDGGCTGGTPGADIDAVCALSYIKIDCAGIVNGTAIVDECGECLEPSDPSFNQSCLDCAGIPNGESILDECGECLEPDNPTFNQSCFDCLGIFNGSALVDECGECLELLDPLFNKTCSEDFYIPNIFSPNSDGINDEFEIFKPSETIAEIKRFSVMDRWGELVYQIKNVEFDQNVKWWNGDFKGRKAQSGVYAYYIEIQYRNEGIKMFLGDITIIK